MALLENGQSCLEKEGIIERNNEIVRSDYNEENQYSATHQDALSDGDPQGKGTGSGGHGAWLPDCTLPKNMIRYSNFDTDNGGGYFDIHGRNDVGGREKSLARSAYNKEYQYGANLVSTDANVKQGQFVVQHYKARG